MLNISETEAFIVEFDTAIEAHMNWSRRILRCAVLHTSPGDDVLSMEAHKLCRFGQWFSKSSTYLETIDLNATQKIEVTHRLMHESIRLLCSNLMNGEPGLESDLLAFEHLQSLLLSTLAVLKTRVLTEVVQNDHLTGLPLRHNIENDFDAGRKIAIFSGEHLFSVLIDIDHFKNINDTYGHNAGDLVLQQLADVLKTSLRSTDIIYRYGGEEFFWLLRCKSKDEAKHCIDRAITLIRDSSFTLSDTEMTSITVTIGVALVSKDENVTEAIGRSDNALYYGKRNGRNRYVFADDLEKL